MGWGGAGRGGAGRGGVGWGGCGGGEWGGRSTEVRGGWEAWSCGEVGGREACRVQSAGSSTAGHLNPEHVLIVQSAACKVGLG